MTAQDLAGINRWSVVTTTYAGLVHGATHWTAKMSCEDFSRAEVRVRQPWDDDRLTRELAKYRAGRSWSGLYDFSDQEKAVIRAIDQWHETLAFPGDQLYIGAPLFHEYAYERLIADVTMNGHGSVYPVHRRNAIGRSTLRLARPGGSW